MIWNSIIQNPHQPQGPQNLAYNSMYSPGHGAFIPLQAVRQNSKVRPIYAQPVYIFFFNSFICNFLLYKLSFGIFL